jgi:hypothetical protein
MQVIISLIVLILIGLALGEIVKLKHKAESVQSVTDARPELPQPSGGSVNAYQADDATGTLKNVPLNVPPGGDDGERLKAILQALINSYTAKNSPHPLAQGAGIHAVYLLKDNSALVDLNAAFVDGHPSGINCEQLTIFSIVETLVANQPQLLRVRFLVDGKPRATLAGHASLTDFYETAAVTQAVKDMQ